jgi:hypothetical protein
MANHKRRDRWNRRMGEKLDQIDNEIQMLVDTHNNHDSGLLGWNALSLEDGSNKRMGQAVLVGGTVTVSNTSVTANTRIFLSHANTSGTLGHLYISARVAGTSFTITSSSATDTSTVNWLLIEPK